MGSGKQWSAGTVRQVKTLMSIGLPLPRIAALTGVVLQTLRHNSACVKKGYTGDKHGNHRGAPTKQTDEMRRWVSDYFLPKPKASVTEVHVEFQRSGFDLSRTTLYRIMHGQRRPVRPIRTHKVQNNPGVMVSGIVNMRDGPLGSLNIVPIDTNAWLDVMTEHLFPECDQ